MKLLYDLVPLLLFFGAFKLYDIYVATAVAIAATLAQIGAQGLVRRRVETLPLVTFGALAVFGGLTLALRDELFIMWKPTIVYWILGVVVLASQWIGRAPVLERLFRGQIALPAAVWAGQNRSWGLFFLALGALNLYVAFYYRPELEAAARQATWVNFKVFGLLALTLAFLLVQGMRVARHLQAPPARDRSGTPH